MAALTLKSILNPRSTNYPTVAALHSALGSNTCVSDISGKILLGLPNTDPTIPVQLDTITIGQVSGPTIPANTLALLLTQLAARENESRSLASEVLHLYREINLIEQLSEQLAALLDSPAVARAALEQAQRLIPATHGIVLLADKDSNQLQTAATFNPISSTPDPEPQTPDPILSPTSPFIQSILARGIGEIINDLTSDPRIPDSTLDPRPQTPDPSLHSLIASPLRSGQSTVGIIALANSDPAASYSAANLKLLNTIALQTAAAFEKSLLAAEMVDNARERAAIAAELHAASTVQQLLLQSASQPTPGFTVDSVYLPASEVGGDFFYVAPAPDGSITAIAGDVSGKGITAAMRVAMILGALRRETSHDPAQILHALNETLFTRPSPSTLSGQAFSSPAQLGFTTAVCVRIALNGHFTLANAGHINPYQSGREIETPPALPLGLVPDQTFERISGHLAPGQTLVLLSDGVPEARATNGELYGFDRLTKLTLPSATNIAQAAQNFGQEDDITVLSLALAR
jgi:serine phosphatase RsbU (regulator of sigma subunit)